MLDDPIQLWAGAFAAGIRHLKRAETAIQPPPPTHPTAETLKTLLEVWSLFSLDEMQPRPVEAAAVKLAGHIASPSNRDYLTDTFRTALGAIEKAIVECATALPS